MNMIMTWTSIFLLILLSSCGSSSKANRKCTVDKHKYDYLFQINIDKKPISEQWFLLEDAQVIAKDLAEKKRCSYNG